MDGVLFKKLLYVLKEQCNLLDKILNTLYKQNEGLRKVDTNAVSASLQQLSVLSKEMQDLDKKREKIQRELIKTHGMKGNITISELITCNIPNEIKNELKQIKLELDERFNKVKEVNEINAVLIKHVLSVVNTVLNIMKSDVSLTYKPESSKKQSGFSVLMNKTV